MVSVLSNLSRYANSQEVWHGSSVSFAAYYEFSDCSWTVWFWSGTETFQLPTLTEAALESTTDICRSIPFFKRRETGPNTEKRKEYELHSLVNTLQRNDPIFRTSREQCVASNCEDWICIPAGKSDLLGRHPTQTPVLIPTTHFRIDEYHARTSFR